MASRKEIHSTEKLLNLIKTSAGTDGEVKSGSVSTPPGRSGAVTRVPRVVSSQRKVTIGVDIGHTYIKLAKIARMSDKSHVLIDYLTVTPGWSFTIEDPKFQDLLKASLKKFCSGHSRYYIWCAIPSAKVETRCLRIPKLPSKQVANAVYWTFTKAVAYSESEELLDYEILGDITEQGIKKTEVLTYKVPKQEVAAIRSLFQHIGYPLTGISIAPFAIQNLLRTGIIPHEDQDLCSLFVGREWSRITIFSKGNLVLSRGIKAGMQSMVDSIQQALIDQKDGSEASAPSMAKQLFDKFLGGAKSSESSGSGDTRTAQIFHMLQPAIERLIRQVERTFEHFGQTFHREGVVNLLLSGRISANPLVVQYIGRQLDLPVTVLNPFGPGNFAQNVNVPTTPEEKESYAPAIGLALSSNALTPNTLYTHREKHRDEAVRQVNMRILTACMICLMVLIGVFSFQGRRLDEKRTQIQHLNQQMSVYQPPAEKDIVLALFSKVKSKRTIEAQTLTRYQPVATINALSQNTPVNIRLLSLRMVLNRSGGNPSPDKVGRGVIIEGLVFGNPNNFDEILAGYLLTLKNSVLFERPGIQDRRIEYFNQQQVLRFKVRLQLI